MLCVWVVCGISGWFVLCLLVIYVACLGGVFVWFVVHVSGWFGAYLDSL